MSESNNTALVIVHSILVIFTTILISAAPSPDEWVEKMNKIYSRKKTRFALFLYQLFIVISIIFSLIVFIRNLIDIFDKAGGSYGGMVITCPFAALVYASATWCLLKINYMRNENY